LRPATVSPIVVVLGVFDEQRIAGGEKKRAQIGVLAKLGVERLAHDRDLDALPVAPQLPLAISPEPRSQHRRAGDPHRFAVTLLLELSSPTL
jgi:hypothetical protein